MDIEQPEDIPDFDGRRGGGAPASGDGDDRPVLRRGSTPSSPPCRPSAWSRGRNQITDDQFFAGQLFAVNNYADAHRAIDEIVSEGEGAKDDPLDFQDELAHYYRFGEVFYDTVLTKIPSRPAINGAPSSSASIGTQVYPGDPRSRQPRFLERSAGGAGGAGGLQRRLYARWSTRSSRR